MSDTIWPVGTDSGKKLRDELRSFIRAQLALSKYRARLPKQHFAVIGEGGREDAGNVIIRASSGPDEKTSWPYDVGANQALQERQAIRLTVKADKKTGGADAVSAFVGVLRDMFSLRFAKEGDSPAERESLENAGVYNCRALPEGFNADPGGETDEGTFFTQQLALRASTDTFLN